MSKASFQHYADALAKQLTSFNWQQIEPLSEALKSLIQNKGALYICGNGGSAANAMHIANDFTYGISPKQAHAINVEALSANSAVITCLGNDIGYDNIFARQLQVKGKPNDLLLVLSGSGNSGNILAAVKEAKSLGMTTAGILGYSGGKVKSELDIALHFAIDDMQISEDLQLVVGHMLMQHLCDQ